MAERIKIGDKIKVKAEYRTYYGEEVRLVGDILDMYIFAHEGEKEASLFIHKDVAEDYLILGASSDGRE